MSKVTPFRRYNLHNATEALRLLARQIEAGEVPTQHCLIVIEQPDGAVTYRAFGNDFTRGYAAGLALCVANRLAVSPDPEEPC